MKSTALPLSLLLCGGVLWAYLLFSGTMNNVVVVVWDGIHSLLSDEIDRRENEPDHVARMVDTRAVLSLTNTHEEDSVDNHVIRDPSHILYDDIYVLFEGTTHVVTGTRLESLYRKDCNPWLFCTRASLPCVDVTNVRRYVDQSLAKMVDGFQEKGTVGRGTAKYEYRISDVGIDTEQVVGQLVSLLTARTNKYADAVCADSMHDIDETIPDKELQIIRIRATHVPGTDGSYADKYIEIDDSQQRLYLWKNGIVVRDYRVSGFFDEYAVYGVFSIREKSPNAWSPIAKKWMPWWMAFYYDPKQGAWFGIHELVWWNDEHGVYHEESSESIGNKKSGGCVRLDRGEAEELYHLINEGDLVLIHP